MVAIVVTMGGAALTLADASASGFLTVILGNPLAVGSLLFTLSYNVAH